MFFFFFKEREEVGSEREVPNRGGGKKSERATCFFKCKILFARRSFPCVAPFSSTSTCT